MIFKRFLFKHVKLRSKLISSYILLTVLPVSVIGYIAYNQYTQSIEEQVGEYIPLLLEQASEDIDNQLDNIKNLPNFIYNSSQVIEILRKDVYQSKSDLLQDQFFVNNYVARTFINGGNPDILGVFIVSKNRLFAKSKVPYSHFDFSDTLPYGQDINTRGQTEILLPHEIPLTFEGNPNYLLVMRPLLDVENRTMLGTVFIAVETTFIKRALENLEQKNESDVWLMDETGRIMYHTNADLVGTIDEKAGHYPNINGSFRTTTERENSLVSTYSSEVLQWKLVHSIQVKQLTENTNPIRDATILLFLLFVMTSTSLYIFFAWNVSNPLYRLTNLMKQVEKGNFDVDFRVHSRDEIGVLANGFNSMTTKIKQLIRENYQSELTQKEAQLYALQSQINPHFIYNTLETINMAVEIGKTDTVVKMVTLLGRMLRYSISNKQTIVPIYQEVMHMNDYLTIQKIRFEDRLHFHIHTEIDTKRYAAPKFILQPIVENSAKYGLEQEDEMSITVSIQECSATDGSKQIVFQIRDNGPGIEEDILARLQRDLESDRKVKRDSSFGLVNVHTRIQMTFGKEYGIVVSSQAGEGTDVVVTIPALEVVHALRRE